MRVSIRKAPGLSGIFPAIHVAAKGMLAMVNRVLRVVVLMAGLHGATGSHAALTPAGQMEVEHLFGFIAASGCEFNRNGTWYDSEKAAAHLRSKYGFLKYSLSVPEDFIDRAAAASSMTGKPYEVRCAGRAPIPSTRWLTDELTRFRLQPGRFQETRH